MCPHANTYMSLSLSDGHLRRRQNYIPRLRTNLSNVSYNYKSLAIDFFLIAQPAGVHNNHCVGPSVRPLAVS